MLPKVTHFLGQASQTEESQRQAESRMDTDLQIDPLDQNMRMRKNLVVQFNPAFFESQRQQQT